MKAAGPAATSQPLYNIAMIIKFVIRILLVNFLFLIGTAAKSQSYIPMLTDSLYWDMAYQVMGPGICNEYGTFDGPYRFSLRNDTIINGLTYKSFKYFQMHRVSQLPGPNCPPFYVDTIPFAFNEFFMREDTAAKQVFRYDSGAQQEDLWFDFNLQLGDSILYPSNGYFTVDSVYYMITPDGKSRKVFLCYDWAITLCGFYIEGIGGTMGPFGPPFHIFEEGWWLMCASDINQINQYAQNNDTLYYCHDFTTSIQQIPKSNTSITPNPATDYINISSDLINYKIIIYDSQGNLKGNYCLTPKTTIDISGFASGIYCIEFRGDSGHYYTNKFVKQ